MSAEAVPHTAGPARALVVDHSPVWAGVLSVLVHMGLLLTLVLGVSWRNAPNQLVQAEIWTQLPEPAIVPRPEPVVEVRPTPEPPSAPKPDIVIKRAAKPKPKLKQTKPPSAKAEQKQREAQKREQRKEARRALEQELQREEKAAMSAELEQVRKQRQRAEMQARTTAQLKSIAIRDAQERIRLKIRGLLRIPEGIKGNPEVVYRVRMFPNGEIMGAPQRIQSSGQPAYDLVVETAILKASPLPLPSDAGLAAEFREGLELRFRPHEG